jgi:hypothetical protein
VPSYCKVPTLLPANTGTYCKVSLSVTVNLALARVEMRRMPFKRANYRHEVETETVTIHRPRKLSFPSNGNRAAEGNPSLQTQQHTRTRAIIAVPRWTQHTVVGAQEVPYVQSGSNAGRLTFSRRDLISFTTERV